MYGWCYYDIYCWIKFDFNYLDVGLGLSLEYYKWVIIFELNNFYILKDVYII